MKILKLILMSMGAIWLLFIAWSYIGLPVVKTHGSMQGGFGDEPERYEELKLFCSSLGLASGKEGITQNNKTILFVGEHADLSNIFITARLHFDNEKSRSDVRYSIRCTYPRWSGSGPEDYKKMVQDLTGIIRAEK